MKRWNYGDREGGWKWEIVIERIIKGKGQDEERLFMRRRVDRNGNGYGGMNQNTILLVFV